RTARDFLDHFGRVTAEVPLDELKHGARVPQGFVAKGRRLPQGANQRIEGRIPPPGGLTAPLPGILPTRGIVLPHESVEWPVLLVPAVLHEAREGAFPLIGVLEILPADGRGVCVVDDVLPEEGVRVPAPAREHVVYQ